MRRIAARCWERSGGRQRIGAKLTNQEVATFVGTTHETVRVELVA
jgi:hypothetical protein